MRFVFLVLLLSAAANAVAGDWETRDSWLLGGALGLLVVDWGQSRDVATRYRETYATQACTDPTTRTHPLAGPCPATKSYDHYEINPLLPEHPTSSEVDRYFAIAMIGTAGLSYALPTRYRRPFLWGVIVLESVVVLRNNQLGLTISF